MKMWYEWAFDGIGTEIISLLIGLIIGGITGYRFGIKNHNKQSQTAGNQSKLTQIGNVTITSDNKEKKNDK